MKSHWRQHNDKRVFIADFSSLGSDANTVRSEADFIKQILQAELPGSVRAITCVDGTFGSPETLQVLAGLLHVTNNHVLRRALVGVSGFRKYFLETFSKLTGGIQFNQFDSLAQALDWITQE